MRELSDRELDAVNGGATGQGVATAFTTGGTETYFMPFLVF